MKKSILMAAVLMAAAASQAVTLNWAANATTSKLFGLTTGVNLTTTAGSSETASMSVYYLLATDLTAVQSTTDEATVAGLAKATASGQVSTSTGAAGRFGASTVITGSDVGVSYFARVFATIGGQDYFMDLKNLNTSYFTTTKTGIDTVTETLGWGTAVYGGATGVQGDFNKWVLVPEPATTALALAGLAMLIRRRK